MRPTETALYEGKGFIEAKQIADRGVSGTSHTGIRDGNRNIVRKKFIVMNITQGCLQRVDAYGEHMSKSYKLFGSKAVGYILE